MTSKIDGVRDYGRRVARHRREHGLKSTLKALRASAGEQAAMRVLLPLAGRVAPNVTVLRPEGLPMMGLLLVADPAILARVGFDLLTQATDAQVFRLGADQDDDKNEEDGDVLTALLDAVHGKSADGSQN